MMSARLFTMKTPSIFSILTATALVGIGSTSAFAQVATEPVGFVSKSSQSGSDVTFAPALHRAPVFTGVIGSIDDADTITVSGTPAWTANQFGGQTHYVLIGSGDREGLFAEITANDADSVDLVFLVQNLGTVDGDKVAAGDEIKIVPYWTLGTLFPDGSVPDLTSLLLFDRTQTGINKSASTVFINYATFGWYDGGTLSNSRIIYPDESVVLRAPAGEVLNLTQVGAVPMERVRTLLSNETPGQDQDIRMTTGLPVPVTVGEYLNPGANGDLDSLLIFDDSQSGQNKSAATVLIYYNSFGWYDGGTLADGYVLQPGQGFIYRKAAANSANDVVVNFQPAYQAPPAP